MWKLVPPNPPRTKVYYIRGTYLGIELQHSTGTAEAAAAKRILATWRKKAERGEFYAKSEKKPATFVSAVEAYVLAGGAGQYLDPIVVAWKDRMAADIDQIALDSLAAELYPQATAATRNRQVYTPVCAVLHRAGIERKFKRPKGWKGKKGTSWLEPEEAFVAFDAADEIDLEFGLLCRHLTYTGLRIDEGLSRPLGALQLERAYLYLPDTKNGEPRGVHLPPRLVEWFRAQPPRQHTEIIRDERGRLLNGWPPEDAGVPFLERSPDKKIFRFHDGGALRAMLKTALRATGRTFPRRQGGFHLFRHTFGSWMHRYGDLDTYGLTRTGAWADADSADRYIHTQAGEEARRSDLLPVPERVGVVEMKVKAS